ncbi:follistatin-related protein 1-like [Lingula anatina]|uniref:Follistatin-related protein 1-like n=1 Tax=Lingula anatina TaxID=7574 RepID=A0A1S3H149_LINAN|nr:follistatin-related protein 1-like [Lingula anatina]|eukprot:XP_013378869.1 follistatin-related protein 1-like [Lingula anatina]
MFFQAKVKEEAATEKDESSLEEKPLVCYQLERDSLRQLLIDWFKTKVEDEGWFYKGKNYTEVLIENFHACDKNQNNKLSAVEFLECVERNDTVRNHGKGAAGGSHAHIIRGLCVDALIIMSDEDSDWQLDLEEFRQCMDPVYSPPTKKCSLEDKMYIDGAEVNVDCNICVCACGNWVCTASSCKTDLKKIAGSYDHHSDQLPSAEERKAILEGFQATDDVDLSRLEEEINRHLDAVSDEDDFGPVPDAHLGRDSHPEDVEEFVANVNTQEQVGYSRIDVENRGLACVWVESIMGSGEFYLH